MIEREDMQAFNISTLRIQQGRSANVSSHSILIGGAIVRNNVHPVLAGEGGECLDRMKPGPARTHVEALINKSLERTATTISVKPAKSPSSERARNWEEVG